MFVTHDGGITWANVTSNLREAAGVVGKVRPGGLLLIDLLNNKARALLVGTSNGVMVTYLAAGIDGSAPHIDDQETGVRWTRFGGCSEFPIVLTAGLSYEVLLSSNLSLSLSHLPPSQFPVSRVACECAHCARPTALFRHARGGDDGPWYFCSSVSQRDAPQAPSDLAPYGVR